MFQPLYIFLAIILNLLVVLVAIYLTEKKIKDVEKINDNRYAYLDAMAEKNETDITNLYTEDNHGMLRPKVDMLADDVYGNAKE